MDDNNMNDELGESQRKENLGKIKNKIVVISGKGGVGKSTVSVNLAYALALNGNKVGIMDVDIHGPSVAKMSGIEGRRLQVSNHGRPSPIEVVNNLFVLSIASMLENPDDPVIWRGPAKMGVIKQFLEEIDWPELDYLVVDCPPGTGDEPLSVIQLIGNVTGTVIVSTPQDVAFLDARKSINFAMKLNVPIIGIVENMAGFVCPHCGKNIDIFKSGGAKKAGADFNVDVLGSIPLDASIVESGDDGKPFVYYNSGTDAGKIFKSIVEKITDKINHGKEDKINEKENLKDKIAIPLDNGMLSEHFGHAELFNIYEIENKKIISSKEYTPPPHEPGSIPKWLYELNVTKIITGGIGQGAINYFNQYKIEVFSGVPVLKPFELIEKYLNGELSTGGAQCDHSHEDSCENH
jgi:ATP-binding protein involved in chromosome partitioning